MLAAIRAPMVSSWLMMAMAPTEVMATVVSMVSVVPRLENPSVRLPRKAARSMLLACLSSQAGRSASSIARALIVVRPEIISATRPSRASVLSRSRRLASAMTWPDSQATTMNTGTITASTQASGNAMTITRPRNRIAKGRSAAAPRPAPRRSRPSARLGGRPG